MSASNQPVELRRDLRVRSRMQGTRRETPREYTCVHTSPPSSRAIRIASGVDVRHGLRDFTTGAHRNGAGVDNVVSDHSAETPRRRAENAAPARREIFVDMGGAR